MGVPSVYDRFYCGREQVLSDLAAVSCLLSQLFLPVRTFGPRPGGSSADNVFHFSRIHRGDSLPIAMARHQHLLFSQLHLRPGKTVLALSCGNGAVCQQLVQFSGVNVIGIDTDPKLISDAKAAAEEAGLSGRLIYHHARSVCEALERIPGCSFDAVFAIELGYRTPSLMTLYEHIQRLLKPSGRFAIYEWCFTDAMTPTNTDHVAAAEKLLRSFPTMAQINSISTIKDLLSTLRTAGLANVAATDLALRDKDIPCWWYGQLSIGTLLAAGRLRIFSPMVLVTGEKGTKSL